MQSLLVGVQSLVDRRLAGGAASAVMTARRAEMLVQVALLVAQRSGEKGSGVAPPRIGFVPIALALIERRSVQ